MTKAAIAAALASLPTDACVLWTGNFLHDGYGRTNRPDGHGSVPAHRVIWEAVNGPIPEGLTIDHLCHTADSSCNDGRSCAHRACVNPAHLEPVTHAENCLRASARRTHCPKGHAYTPENTLPRTDGIRRCLTCRRTSDRARYLRIKETAA